MVPAHLTRVWELITSMPRHAIVADLGDGVRILQIQLACQWDALVFAPRSVHVYYQAAGVPKDRCIDIHHTARSHCHALIVDAYAPWTPAVQKVIHRYGPQATNISIRVLPQIIGSAAYMTTLHEINTPQSKLHVVFHSMASTMMTSVRRERRRPVEMMRCLPAMETWLYCATCHALAPYCVCAAEKYEMTERGLFARSCRQKDLKEQTPEEVERERERQQLRTTE